MTVQLDNLSMACSQSSQEQSYTYQSSSSTAMSYDEDEENDSFREMSNDGVRPEIPATSSFFLPIFRKTRLSASSVSVGDPHDPTKLDSNNEEAPSQTNMASNFFRTLEQEEMPQEDYQSVAMREGLESARRTRVRTAKTAYEVDARRREEQESMDDGYLPSSLKLNLVTGQFPDVETQPWGRVAAVQGSDADAPSLAPTGSSGSSRSLLTMEGTEAEGDAKPRPSLHRQFSSRSSFLSSKTHTSKESSLSGGLDDIDNVQEVLRKFVSDEKGALEDMKEIYKSMRTLQTHNEEDTPSLAEFSDAPETPGSDAAMMNFAKAFASEVDKKYPQKLKLTDLFTWSTKENVDESLARTRQERMTQYLREMQLPSGISDLTGDFTGDLTGTSGEGGNSTPSDLTKKSSVTFAQKVAIPVDSSTSKSVVYTDVEGVSGSESQCAEFDAFGIKNSNGQAPLIPTKPVRKGRRRSARLDKDNSTDPSGRYGEPLSRKAESGERPRQKKGKQGSKGLVKLAAPQKDSKRTSFSNSASTSIRNDTSKSTLEYSSPTIATSNGSSGQIGFNVSFGTVPAPTDVKRVPTSDRSQQDLFAVWPEAHRQKLYAASTCSSQEQDSSSEDEPMNSSRSETARSAYEISFNWENANASANREDSSTVTSGNPLIRGNESTTTSVKSKQKKRGSFFKRNKRNGEKTEKRSNGR